MVNESNHTTLSELTTQLLIAQQKSQPMTTDEICASLQTIYDVLRDCQQQEKAESDKPIFKSPYDSIGKEVITCLECGKAFVLLSSSHLTLHGLTPTEYKDKHGFRRGQPLSCKALSAKRKRHAVQNDMGSELAQWRESRKQANA